MQEGDVVKPKFILGRWIATWWRAQPVAQALGERFRGTSSPPSLRRGQTGGGRSDRELCQHPAQTGCTAKEKPQLRFSNEQGGARTTACGPRRGRWILYTAGALPIVTLIWIMCVFFQIFTFAAEDHNRSADAAVILGAAVWHSSPSDVFRERIEHGINLHCQGRARYLIFTGSVGKQDYFAESEIGRDISIRNGVAPGFVLTEMRSTSTFENLNEAFHLMQLHNLDTASIVSNELHLWRALRYAEDIGINAFPEPTPTSKYVSLKTRLTFALRETAAYAVYQVTPNPNALKGIGISDSDPSEMNAMDIELTILLLGVTAALTGLQGLREARLRTKFVFFLLLAGLTVQVITHVLQYWNVSKGRSQAKIELEGRLAHAIWAYTDNNTDLLAIYAEHVPYLLGYRAFKNREYDRARLFFDRSIESDQFVAASSYMIAHLIRIQGGDHTDVRRYLAQALEHDPKYAAAYYSRAIVRLQAKEFALAREDLSEAVLLDPGPCHDLRNPENIHDIWKVLDDNEFLQGLQRDCGTLHNIPAPH